MRLLLFMILTLLGSLRRLKALSPIDNAVMGTPLVECGEKALAFNANTRKMFTGRVLVQGMSRYQECVYDFGDRATTNLQITIPIGKCKMQRTRMVQPTGVQQSITLIVSFHPIFITEVDKAYRLHCSYVLTEKRLTQHLEVSTMATQEIAGTLPPPTCEYTVHREGPQGPLVQYATVGEPLFHVWRCSSSADFRMMVRNCIIEDSGSMRFAAIDRNGCSSDRRVINELQYTNDSKEAFVEMHAFKFADDVNVHFRCEIILCPIGEEICRKALPPSCDNATLGDLVQRNTSVGLTVLPRSSAAARNPRHLRQKPFSKDYAPKNASGTHVQPAPPRHITMDVVPQNRFYILDRRLDLDEEKPGIDDDEHPTILPYSVSKPAASECHYSRWRTYSAKFLCLVLLATLIGHAVLLVLRKYSTYAYVWSVT